MKPLAELTAHCIRCGFCLESCPTFVTTGSELESPRGRIYLVRSADEGQLDWEDIRPHMDQCLGCLACTTACPSGVEYGQILEIARNKLEEAKPDLPKGALLTGTTRPFILTAQLSLGNLVPGTRIPGFVSRLLSGQAAEADKPRAQPSSDLEPLIEGLLPAVIGEVYLLEGCAMRVLFPRVHQATRRLLRRVGFVVREVHQGCCGALHAHNGHLDDASNLGSALVRAMPDDLPVVVNSAGCGSTMKEYGQVIGDGAEGFARRVVDLSEFLWAHGLLQLISASEGICERVTYHDACHLAHGQKITRQPRTLIAAIPRIEFVDLPEADLCCGSAGIYNVTQPRMARTLLERKYANIESTGAAVVATGNPGCHSWIAQAAREHGRIVTILHTAELLEASFVGLQAFSESGAA